MSRNYIDESAAWKQRSVACREDWFASAERFDFLVSAKDWQWPANAPRVDRLRRIAALCIKMAVRR